MIFISKEIAKIYKEGGCFMGKYDALFQPMKIGQLELKNRISMAPMGGTQLIIQGKFNEKSATNFITRAKGGTGLLITGAHGITDMWGRGGWLYEAADNFIEPCRKFMDEVHSYGAKVFVEVTAGQGRNLWIHNVGNNDEEYRNSQLRVPKDADLPNAMYCPSELPNFWIPERKHREMTREEIYQIIDAFGKTAKMLKDAHIDGIDIHALHEGYLLDEFAQKNLNHRTDEFGGSLDNRLRFITSIIKEIKKQAGEDFPVTVRYSVRSYMKDFNAGALPGEYYEEFGRTLEESPVIARKLQEAGCDGLTADNGCYESWYFAHPPTYMPLCCNLEDSVYLQQYVDIPLLVAGRMEDVERSTRAIETGAIAGICLGRQLLCDPEWPNKVQREELDDIRPCIGCQTGCFGRLLAGKGTSCAVNPCANQEAVYKIVPAETKKKVVVVGGGIGGMEAARVLTLRGHEVTLFEKGDKLGGVFVAAAAFDFKEADKKLIQWFIKQVKDLKIDVRLNTEATPELIAAQKPDAVIIATGSTARQLPIPGVDADHVIEATDLLLGKKEAGDRVVVVGGGLTGCEIAYSLAKEGKNVSVLEMKEKIMDAPGMCDANIFCLRDLMALNNVSVHVNAALKSVTKGGVVYMQDGVERCLPANTVIMAAGYNSNGDLADEIKDCGEVYKLGDAKQVGNLLTVVWGAWDIAMAI